MALLGESGSACFRWIGRVEVSSEMGFSHVASGPLVRSGCRADRIAKDAKDAGFVDL